MELFLNYFIPAICLLLIGTIPLYLIRIYMYFARKHFMLQEKTFRISMYIHAAVYVAFAITMLLIINHVSDMKVVIYIYIIMGVVLVLLFIGYRYQFLHQKMNRYTVLYSRWNNREAWQKLLDDQHLSNVDIDEGSFSFVSKIHFKSMNPSEIKEVLNELDKNSELLHPLNTRRALSLLAFQVSMFSFCMVAFALFFVLITIL